MVKSSFTVKGSTGSVLKDATFDLDKSTALVVKENKVRGVDSILRCWNVSVEVATLVDLTAVGANTGDESSGESDDESDDSDDEGDEAIDVGEAVVEESKGGDEGVMEVEGGHEVALVINEQVATEIPGLTAAEIEGAAEVITLFENRSVEEVLETKVSMTMPLTINGETVQVSKQTYDVKLRRLAKLNTGQLSLVAMKKKNGHRLTNVAVWCKLMTVAVDQCKSLNRAHILGPNCNIAIHCVTSATAVVKFGLVRKMRRQYGTRKGFKSCSYQLPLSSIAAIPSLRLHVIFYIEMEGGGYRLQQDRGVVVAANCLAVVKTSYNKDTKRFILVKDGAYDLAQVKHAALVDAKREAERKTEDAKTKRKALMVRKNAEKRKRENDEELVEFWKMKIPRIHEALQRRPKLAAQWAGKTVEYVVYDAPVDSLTAVAAKKSKTKDAKLKRTRFKANNVSATATVEQLKFDEKTHLPWCSARFRGGSDWYIGVVLSTSEKSGKVVYDIEYDVLSQQAPTVYTKDVEFNVPETRINFILTNIE